MRVPRKNSPNDIGDFLYQEKDRETVEDGYGDEPCSEMPIRKYPVMKGGLLKDPKED